MSQGGLLFRTGAADALSLSDEQLDAGFVPIQTVRTLLFCLIVLYSM